MDAFLKYLSETDKYGNRLFICNAPGPVLLAWANFSNGADISGLTMVNRLGFNNEYSESAIEIIRLIKESVTSSLPFFSVEYSDDASSFQIEGQTFDGPSAANFLSKELQIYIGANPAKKANDPKQIIDAFHMWSREAFDGIRVRKIDIDALLLSEKRDRIETLIEIKRSKKIPVGKWLPYIDSTSTNTDYWNYLLAINLSKILKTDFVTIHHEKMTSEESFTDTDLVDQFIFKFNNIISKETFEHFGSEANRKKFEGIKFEG